LKKKSNPKIILVLEKIYTIPEELATNNCSRKGKQKHRVCIK